MFAATQATFIQVTQCLLVSCREIQYQNHRQVLLSWSAGEPGLEILPGKDAERQAVEDPSGKDTYGLNGAWTGGLPQGRYGPTSPEMGPVTKSALPVAKSAPSSLSWWLESCKRSHHGEDSHQICIMGSAQASMAC